jgi:hypothetical protein
MALLKGRYTAQIDGDFVLFLIGMRINNLLAVHKWVPTVLAMPRMLRELKRQPELGLLHYEVYLSGLTILVVQYWRSFEQLHSYSHAKDFSHLPAWGAFNRRARGNSAVGIYHETFMVSADGHESIFVNLPRRGLARAGQAVAVSARSDNARQRLKKLNESE